MRRASLLTVSLAMVVLGVGGPHDQGVEVPFVGCPADGQVGPIEAPQGKPRTVALDTRTAGRIAFYKGDVGFGVFAPRGWHCRVWYGSGGETIIVTPGRIDSGTHRRLGTGQAVELMSALGGTSGRFTVARYASQLFRSAAAEFIERVKSESLVPTADLIIERSSNDSMTYSDILTVTFTTAANKPGLGTQEDLDPSSDMIHGIAVLDTSGDWEIHVLDARLGTSLRQVEAAILKLNKDCMRRSEGC